MKQRVYIDTSVIGGCFDDEFSSWSVRFFEEIRNGNKIAVISDLTRRELEPAPAYVRRLLSTIQDDHLINVFLSEESVNLKLGYPVLEIRSPREVIHEEEI